MGTFFSIYQQNDVLKLNSEDRNELRSAIIWALQHDPEVLELVEENLPDIRDILRKKTKGVFDRLRKP
jgi:hypothetical protein